MALKIVVYYKNEELTFAVTKQEDDVYYLRTANSENHGTTYVPEKIIIRRKGKLWVSDVEDYPDLIAQLTAEVKQLSVTNEMASDE